MKNIYKITNIALIFTLIGMMVCSELGYADNAALRIPSLSKYGRDKAQDFSNEFTKATNGLNDLIEISLSQDWQTVFEDNSKPLVVNVGFGEGETLLQRALTEPDKNFIGIESWEDYVTGLKRKVQEHRIKNLKILNAEDIEAFQAQVNSEKKYIISEFDYYHPDPHDTYIFDTDEGLENLITLLSSDGLVRLLIGEEFYKERLVGTFESKGFYSLTPNSSNFPENLDPEPTFSKPEHRLLFSLKGPEVTAVAEEPTATPEDEPLASNQGVEKQKIRKTLRTLGMDEDYIEQLLVERMGSSRSEHLDRLYMEIALRLAEKKQEEGKPPIASIAVNNKSGEIIIGEKAAYKDKRFGDVTLNEHAEINALKKAVDSGWDMSDTVLYIIVETCINCSVAIVNCFRPHRVVMGSIDAFPSFRGRGFEIIQEGGIAAYFISFGSIQERIQALMRSFYDSLPKTFQQSGDFSFVPVDWHIKNLTQDSEALQVAINAILSGRDQFTIDTPSILTMLVSYFIRRNGLLPGENYPQIVALDANHMNAHGSPKLYYRDSLIREVMAMQLRINSREDRSKVVLLGEDKNIRMCYRELLDSGLVEPNRVYVLKGDRLISYPEWQMLFRPDPTLASGQGVEILKQHKSASMGTVGGGEIASNIAIIDINHYLQILGPRINEDEFDQIVEKTNKEANKIPPVKNQILYERLKKILSREFYNEHIVEEDLETAGLLCTNFKEYFDSHLKLNPTKAKLTRDILVRIIRDLLDLTFEREDHFIVVDFFAGHERPLACELVKIGREKIISNKPLLVVGIDNSIPWEKVSSENGGIVHGDIYNLLISRSSTDIVIIINPDEKRISKRYRPRDLDALLLNKPKDLDALRLDDSIGGLIKAIVIAPIKEAIDKRVSIKLIHPIVASAKRILKPDGKIYIAPYHYGKNQEPMNKSAPKRYRRSLIIHGFRKVKTFSPYPDGYPVSSDWGKPSCLIKAQKPFSFIAEKLKTLDFRGWFLAQSQTCL